MTKRSAIRIFLTGHAGALLVFAAATVSTAAPQSAPQTAPAGRSNQAPPATGGRGVTPAAGQTGRSGAPATTPAAQAGRGATAPVDAVQPPTDYVIGPEDVLRVLFWRDETMTTEVVVRPDGKITIALIGDVQAAGLSTAQLTANLTTAAAKWIQDPAVTVSVKQINSRKVFITGSINKPGPYPLAGTMTVLQLIATAGGPTEYAKGKNISVVRVENGQQKRYPFNYNDVSQGKNLKQNIELKVGDTVIVP